jgi:hypothetical protein
VERLIERTSAHRISFTALVVAALAISASLSLAEVSKGGALMTAADQYPVSLHSTATETEFPNANRWTFTDGTGLPASCAKVTLTGTLGWARTTPVLHPEFSECKSPNTGGGVSFTTTGCDFRLHIGATVGETGRYDGTVGIECEAGKAIKVFGDTCELLIDPQEARSTIELSNVAGSPDDVSVKWSLAGLAYTVVKDGILCKLSGVGTKETGDFTSTATLTAKDAEGKAVGLTVEMGEKTPTEEKHLEEELEEAEHTAQTAHETQTAEEAQTAHEAETAGEEEGVGGGALMTAADQYPVSLHSTATETEFPNANRWTFTDGTGLPASCAKVTLTGTLGWARTTPVLHPEFSECKSPNTGGGVSFTTTGCDFRLHIGATVGETGRYDGTVGIECEAGKAIKVFGDTCELLIDPQEARSTIELSNVAGSPDDVSVKWSLAGLAYTVVKDGILCKLSGVGTKETGDFTSTATLTAKDAEGKAVGLTVEMR